MPQPACGPACLQAPESGPAGANRRLHDERRDKIRAEPDFRERRRLILQGPRARAEAATHAFRPAFLVTYGETAHRRGWRCRRLGRMEVVYRPGAIR